MIESLTSWIAGLLNAELYNDDLLRARFVFDSPNDFAAAIAMGLALILVVGDHLTDHAGNRHLPRYVAFAIMLAGAALGAFLLAATYSRSGYLAAILSAVILLMVTRRFRWPLLAGLLIVISAALAPATGKRINSGISRDASVTNRLVLWGDAARMSLHGPAWGWRKAGFERSYWRWFQSRGINARYQQAVSNFFTVAVYYGPAGALVYSFAIATFLIVGAALAANCVFARIGLLTQSAFHACGVFSFTHAEPGLNIMLLLSLAFTLLAVVVYLWERPKSNRPGRWRLAAGIGVLGAIPVVVLMLFANRATRADGFAYADLVLGRDDTGVLQLERLTLSPKRPFARLFWIYGKGDSDAYDRYLLKELARQGVLVTWISAGPLSTEGVETLGAQLPAWLAGSAPRDKLPAYLGGSGSGAQLALLVAQKSNSWPVHPAGLWIFERLARTLPPQLVPANSATLPLIRISNLKIDRPARMNHSDTAARLRESQLAEAIAAKLAGEFTQFAGPGAINPP